MTSRSRALRSVVLAAHFGAALLIAPTTASARPTITVARVDVPERDDALLLRIELKHLLTEAIHKANFGPGDRKTRVEVTARLTEFSAEAHGDVLQIRCTMSGRLTGGHGARSRISFGGRPADRAKLEKQVLKMVANGLVARLAQIARSENGR